mgnify:CR=1 FL=1
MLDRHWQLLEDSDRKEALFTVVFRTLSEGAEEDGSAEEDAPCQCSEMILDAIGCKFHEESPFVPLLPSRSLTERVLQEAQKRLASTDWHDRRTALTAMLVIMEYTSDIFRPLLASLLPTLRPFLADPVPAVRRKAAFFFSECGYYCEGAFMEAAPWIISDLQQVGALRDTDTQMLNGEEFDVLSALYILETVAPDIVLSDPALSLTLIVRSPLLPDA